MLFEDLPFTAQLNNPAIENVVKGKETDDFSIQKFLLATGLLEDTIQNNLDMIVTDNDFNNAGIRRALDQKYLTIMGKPTATNFIFKDKAKFDIQNPVIGGIYNELLSDKQKEKKQIEEIGKAPDVRDIDIKKRLDSLGKFNKGITDDDDDDDDDDNNNNNNNNNNVGNLDFGNLIQPPSPGPLTPPITPSSFSSIKKFLLDDGNTKTLTSTPKTVSFSQTLTKVFPKTKRELIPLEPISEDETEDFDITESSVVSSSSSSNHELINLDFYTGGENSQKLFEHANENVGNLNESNQEFLRYLSGKYGSYLLRKNKMKIHVESGKIFYDEKSTGESLYDFLKVQEDVKKKELKIEIPVQNDFTTYVREILTNIVDNDYDLQTNSTSKFLFYNFNNVRVHLERKLPIKIRHSEIVENEEALRIVQSHNWQYFIETLLNISNSDVEIERDEFKDDEAFEDYLIIEKTQKNLKYCKKFYEEIFDDIAYFLQRKIKETPDDFVEKMEEDLANQRIFFKKLKKIESSTEFLKIFNEFYFKTGRFPGNSEFIIVPPGENPSFVERYNQISPVEINEKFKNSEAYGIAAVQFIAALNVFFGGDKTISKNVMSELLHNLSLEALTIDDDRVEVEFFQIIELNNNLKSLIRDDERDEILIHENYFQNEIVESEKDKIEMIEEEVVENIVNNEKIEYPIKNFGTYPSTNEEIVEETRKNDEIKKRTEETLNQRDEEISLDIISESRKDLMKSVSDNLSEDILETVSLTALPKVVKEKESVEEHIKKTIKKNNRDFLKKKKSSVTLKVSPRKSPRTRLTDLLTKEEKKKRMIKNNGRKTIKKFI